MLLSSVGYDVSSRVEGLELSEGVRELHNIAMGSSEGYESAERAISLASKEGCWVLLKNVHLCCDWLAGLEKRINTIVGLHNNFRLFLTAEASEKLPANVIR